MKPRGGGLSPSGSIRRQFRLLSIKLVIVPIVLLGCTLLGVAAVTLPRLTTSQQMLAAQFAASQLQSLALQYEELFDRLSVLNSLGDRSRTEIQSSLATILERDRAIERMVVTTSSGVELARAERANPGPPGEGGTSWLHAQAFTTALQERKPYAGDFHISETTGAPLLRVSIPIFGPSQAVAGRIFPENRVVNGILIGEIKLHVVQRSLESLPVRNGESAYLLDTTGRIVAHTNLSVVHRAVTGTVPPKQGLTEGLNGRTVVTAHVPFSLGDGNFYSVVERTVAPAYTPILLAILVICVVFGAVGVGIVRAGRLIRNHVVGPLERLSRTVAEIGSGNLDVTAERSALLELRVVSDGLERLATNMRESFRELHETIEERETLLREVHHRVKNNLQIMTSMLRLQANQPSYRADSNVLLDATRRIHSISLVHEQIYESSSLATIEVAAFLDRLIRQIRRSFGEERSNVDLEVHAEALHLDVERAIPCAMIASEAITNCLKHAFPYGQAGRITVSFGQDYGGYAILSISDDGDGASEEQLDSHGLGTTLLHTLGKQLGGELAVESDSSGTTVRVAFPWRE